MYIYTIWTLWISAFVDTWCCEEYWIPIELIIMTNEHTEITLLIDSLTNGEELKTRYQLYLCL